MVIDNENNQMRLNLFLMVMIVLIGCQNEMNIPLVHNETVKSSKLKIAEYDENGNYKIIRNLNYSKTELVESATLKCSIIKFEYEKDQLLSIAYLNEDGSLSSKTSRIDFIYDDSKKLQEQKSFDRDNKEISTTFYEYDDLGRLIEKQKRDFFPSTNKFEYLDDRKAINVKFYDEDNEFVIMQGRHVIFNIDYLLDEENRIVKENIYYKERDSLANTKAYSVKSREFIYDITGKLTSCLITNGLEYKKLLFHYASTEQLYGWKYWNTETGKVFLNIPYQNYQDVVTDFILVSDFLNPEFPTFK